MISIYVITIIYIVLRIKSHLENKRKEAERNANLKMNENGEILCPFCGSSQIQLVNKKWDGNMGLLTNKVQRVCVRCMKKF